MIGSTCYSGSSFLYLLVVTRICGAQLAGFYSLSYATAQLLLQVGRYGVRTYQATDLEHKYLFSEYKVSRCITCALMMLFGIIYSSFSIMMKMIDAVEDVFHGNLQQKYHVEQMGKMLAARNLYSAVFFTVVLLITKSLYLTCVATPVTSLVLCLLINSQMTRKCAGHEEDGRKLQMAHVWELLRTCTPMFIGTFLSLLLYNIPKYAMAGVMTDEYQTYYSILFMPSFVISLMCEFVFKPTITTIAELWWENNVKRFTLYILRIIGIILVCCAGVVAGGHLIGRTLLEIIYGVDLSPYKLHFVVLLIGGGISAEVYMIYNILIAIRWGKCLLPVYSVTAVITIAAARIMVRQWGIMGAALNYVLSCSILFILFTGILIFVVSFGTVRSYVSTSHSF